MITDQFTMYDAAYVLGALSPSDRREFENHLEVCSACARSVSELAGLPGLMSKVSIDQLTAEPEPVPETLLPSLARAVRRQRMRRRVGVGAAAAAAAACLVAVAGVAINQPDSPARPPVASTPSSSPGSTAGSANLALTSVVDNSPVTASARLVGLAWGTRIDLTCTYDAAKRRPPPGGLPYALVVVDRKGAAEQVATWKALPNRTLTVMGTSSRDRADIAAVEVRTMRGRTILRSGDLR